MVRGFYRQEYRDCGFLMEGHLCCALPRTGQTNCHRIELGLGFRVRVKPLMEGRRMLRSSTCGTRMNTYKL